MRCGTERTAQHSKGSNLTAVVKVVKVVPSQGSHQLLPDSVRAVDQKTLWT